MQHFHVYLGCVRSFANVPHLFYVLLIGFAFLFSYTLKILTMTKKSTEESFVRQK